MEKAYTAYKKSLRNIALTAFAVSLFHQKLPMENLHELLNKNNYEHRQKWNALEKEIYLETAEKEIFNALLIKTATGKLIKCIIEQLKCIIIPISHEILDWSLFFFNMFGYKDFYLVKEFCWIPGGRIDGEKTIKKLLGKKALLPKKNQDILLKFKMAAYFCLKEEMESLMECDSELLKDSLETDFRECPYATSEMLSLWSKIFLSEPPIEKKEIFETLLNLLYHKRFNCSAVIYFCNINEFSSREEEVRFISNCLEHLKSSIETERDFPKSYETGTAFYLLEKLNNEELEKILSEHQDMTEYVLSLCTEYWFWDKFFKYKEVLAKFISHGRLIENSYYSNTIPLLEIFKKIPQDPVFYKEMFSTVWKSIEEKDAEVELILKSGLANDSGIFNFGILLQSRDKVAELLFSEYYKDLISIMCSLDVETKEWFVVRQIEREPFSGFVERFIDEKDKNERTKFVSSFVECLDKRTLMKSWEKYSEIEATVEKSSRLMINYILGEEKFKN